MSTSNEELIQKAKKAQQNAYAPYSQFKVGAALLTNEEQIFLGCNIENSTFGATNCAERTAVFNAVCNGVREFKKLVIVSDSNTPVMPCGICRQVLFEFSPDIEIISVGTTGNIEQTTLPEIFPKGFRFNKTSRKS